MENIAARALLALIWLLHWLPLGLQAVLGRGLGRVMHALARGRRAVALRNVELCLPELDLSARQALVREHFQWLARSLLERAVLWHASPERLRRLTALVEITLDRQGAEHLQAFEERAVADAAVQQCYRVSPGPDFVLVLHVPDMTAYHALVQRLFTQDANVRNVKSFFSVKRGKFDLRLPLPLV